MALRRRKKKSDQGVPERLSLFHCGGRSWTRELESGSLQVLLQSTLAAGGISAQVSWEQAGQLGTSLLLLDWPDFLAPPAAVFLRRSPRKPFGLELSVDLEGADEVQEYGEDLRRFLMGEQRLAEVQSCVAAEEEEPVVVAQPTAQPTAPSRSERPVVAPSDRQPDVAPPDGQPVVAPPGRQPVVAPPQQSTVVEPEPESVAENIQHVEVIAPGERLSKATARTWSQSEDDLFGLAGEVHPDDQSDHGLEICSADLPWLNPGDSIISPRRGPCRIKRVEDEARQVVAKDENGQLIVISFRELLAEFQFDDGN